MKTLPKREEQASKGVIDLPVKLNPMTKGHNIEKHACPNCNKDIQFLINRDTGTWCVIGGYSVGTLGTSGDLVVCPNCKSISEAVVT